MLEKDRKFNRPIMNIEKLYDYFLNANQSVSTDSRKIQPGSLFFALKGNNFDGNQYTQDALEAGATYAVIDDPQIHQQTENTILVDDVLSTLQQLATHHRRQFHIPIIAITGSNGKTTTKELIAAVLGTHYKVHFTRGNLNNHIGVPLTLLQIPMDAEVAIIEMGANHQGEIANLSSIAEPSHGIITNIGKAHLEGFGGIEGVKKGKSELYRYLAKTNGTAFINRDENFLTALAQSVDNQIFYFQSDKPSLNEPGYETVLLQEKPLIKIAYLDKDGTLVEANTFLFGIHNFQNIITAVCIGKYFKVPAGKIKYAFENYIPQNNRSQLLEWKHGCTIMLDAYNANPSSMEATLNHFAALDTSLQKWVILGDMLELGEASYREHRRITNLALEHFEKENIILVGKLFKQPATEFDLKHFENVVVMKDWFDQQNWQNSYFLLKGSRGIQLEILIH